MPSSYSRTWFELFLETRLFTAQKAYFHRPELNEPRFSNRAGPGGVEASERDSQDGERAFHVRGARPPLEVIAAYINAYKSEFGRAHLPRPEGPGLQDRPKYLLRLPRPAEVGQSLIRREALAVSRDGVASS